MPRIWRLNLESKKGLVAKISKDKKKNSKKGSAWWKRFKKSVFFLHHLEQKMAGIVWSLINKQLRKRKTLYNDLNDLNNSRSNQNLHQSNLTFRQHKNLIKMWQMLEWRCSCHLLLEMRLTLNLAYQWSIPVCQHSSLSCKGVHPRHLNCLRQANSKRW